MNAVIGRPGIEDDQRLSFYVGFYITENDYKRLKKLIHKKRITCSMYIRNLLLDNLDKEEEK